MRKFIKKFLFSASFVSALSYAGGDMGSYDIVMPFVESCASGCNQNSYYLDKQTNLMWEDIAFSNDCDKAYKNNKSACKAGDFYYAKNYCATLNYAGYTDWRLPTSDEMMNVSKKDKVFKNNRRADFWTSTPAGEGNYYVVFSVDGFRYERPASQSNYIRCVRCLTK